MKPLSSIGLAMASCVAASGLLTQTAPLSAQQGKTRPKAAQSEQKANPDALTLVDFKERIPVGALVTCVATVDYVGNSSMDITVEVYAEKISTGERRHTNTAHVVFVAIDAEGKPRRVPRLVAETDEERERYARAEAHRHRQQQHRPK